MAGYPARKPDGCTGGIRGDAVAMLWQQGVMCKVSYWESEVEGAMREMARRVKRMDPTNIYNLGLCCNIKICQLPLKNAQPKIVVRV